MDEFLLRQKINYLQALLDGDFTSDSRERSEQEAIARLVAKAAGWKTVGSTYKHETKGSYLIREMDGWSDLCGIEGLAVEDWIEKITTDDGTETLEVRVYASRSTKGLNLGPPPQGAKSI